MRKWVILVVHEIIVPFGEESIYATPMGMVAREEDGACNFFMGIVKSGY